MKGILLLFIIVSFSKMAVSQNPTFWGMANSGNINDAGGIFEANDSTTENNPYSGIFCSQSLGGGFIQVPGGLLYGLTQYGGNYNNGAIFTYNISTGVENILHSFNGTFEGELPQGSLLLASNGLLYGTTRSGGQGSGTPAGTLFSFDTLTWQCYDLYSFDAGVQYAPAYPTAAPMQLNASLLYGFTSGVGYSNTGTIYYYNINTGYLTVQYLFRGGAGGSKPCGTPVFANDTVLYGMTNGGGANGYGVIFKYDIFNSSETVLHIFGGADGQYPAPNGSLLLVNDSLLYGLTSYGGANGDGVIFDYNILTGVESTLFSFNDTDGSQPNGSLVMGSDGLLYGTTVGGGINYVGTLFNFNPRTNVEHVIYNFPVAGPYNPTGDMLEVDMVYSNPSNKYICAGDSVLLTATGASSYSWSPSYGLNSTTGDSVIATPTVTTVYNVTGKGAFGILTSATDTIVVYLSPIVEQMGDTLFSSDSTGNRWYLNDSLLPDTNRYIIAATRGWYYVVGYNQTNCSTASDSVYVAPTGINQLPVNNSQLSIYPNPASNQLTVESGQGTVNAITITNLLGQTELKSPSGDLGVTKQTIDVSTLPDGLYFITVNTDTGTVTEKFVVVKN